MKEDNLTGRLNVSRDNLAPLLKEAREAKGFSLEEIAEKLKVRPSLLENLESGRYNELPEMIYTRAYIQKYAQLVGLTPDPFVVAYERIAATSSSPTVARSASRTVIESAPIVRTPPQTRNPVVGYVLMFFGLVLIGVLAFLLTRGGLRLPSVGTAPASAPTQPTLSIDGELEQTGINPRTGMVRLSISSLPTGATVQLDKYNIGTTPLKGALVDSRPNRELRVIKAGYKPFITTRDLTSNSNLSVTLEKLPGTTPSVATGKIALIYRGSSWTRIRDQDGKELYQGTPRPGTRLEFDPPIEVRLGAPSLVSAVVGGVTRERLGGSSPATIRLP
jgi:cytoskeleton protein RodZ